MNAMPLIKTKWSNEHVMAAAFLVLTLYHLPVWNEKPSEIVNFILLVCFGLLIDSVAVILRHKRLWCCVSGAVTAAMISLLTPGVFVWGRLLGVAAALILGKHIWGGTGKNPLNPAMLGLLSVLLLFKVSYPYFEPSFLLIPAVVLSLVFLPVRPFAGIGYILGMIAALVFNRELSAENVLSYGVIFWGCLVMTDPVTVTPHRAGGAAAGFIAGFATLYYFPVPVAGAVGVLAVNLFSGAIDSIISKTGPIRAKRRIPKVFLHPEADTEIIDLTGKKAAEEKEDDIGQLSGGEILDRIRSNAVYGMGGAAFPAYQKIKTAADSTAEDKYLIINAVECDPGLIHDEWLLRHHSGDIRKAVQLLNSCIKFRSIHLAVKDKAGLAISQPVELYQVPDRYPIGAEKILIKMVLGREIGYDQIPASEGILVLNIQTLYSISQAVLRNQPTDTRFLTVADLKNKSARVVKVRLGMKLKEILEAVYPGAFNIYAGGGIMQAHVTEEDAYVDRNINFIATGSFPVYKESPQCSGCGVCTRNCPVGLKVNRIADLVEQGKPKEAARYHAQECISCGSCSYSCLAGRNLAAKVKTAKDAIRAGA